MASRKEHRVSGEYTTYNCPTGKRTYSSRKAAKASYKQHLRKHDHMRAYTCPECGGWHLGHLDYATMRGLR